MVTLDERFNGLNLILPRKKNKSLLRYTYFDKTAQDIGRLLANNIIKLDHTTIYAGNSSTAHLLPYGLERIRNLSEQSSSCR